jgi:hypothetical protein
MRAAPHDGQMPRPLQEKATTSSAPQPSQCTRATPCASTPQRKNASISRRQKRGTERSFAASSPWVFPVHRRKQLVSHIIEVDEQREVDGKRLRGFIPSPHRLRDTFLSAAHDFNVSPLDQKALANHALPSSDITEGYIRPGLENLRVVAEKIAAFLLAKAGQRSAVLTIVVPWSTVWSLNSERRRPAVSRPSL